MTRPPTRFQDEDLRSLRSGEARPETALELLRANQARFLRLHFCDLSGTLRYLDVPPSRFSDVLSEDALFAGSAAGIEEAGVRLRPDLATLRLLPWETDAAPVAGVICDVRRPDGAAYEGDPRAVLRRVLGEAADEGYDLQIAAAVELFLLTGDEPVAGDALAAGEEVRMEIVEALEAAGITVASAHAGASPGQHEISLLPTAPLTAADQLAMLKPAARRIAAARRLRASFLPKPWRGASGSGLHLHHVLLRDGTNAFADGEASDGLSELLRGYVGGILRHARGMAAVTNPLVNSYKRLVPGFAAPVHATWSFHDTAPLVRVPPERGDATRCEVRLADPAANAYLALAAQIAAGLQGVRDEVDPGKPTSRETGVMRDRELRRRRIPRMPRDLREALSALEEDRVVRRALGEHVYSRLVEAKRAEWEAYSAEVHPWERERYRGV